MKLGQVIIVILIQLQVFVSANLLREYVRQSSRPQRHGPSIWDSSSKTKGFQWVDKHPYKYGIESFADGLCGEKLPFDAVKESGAKPSVIKEMEKLNYAVNEKPGDVNVIGVRQTNPLGVCKNGKSSACWKKVFTNKFQDELHIVWKCNNNKWRYYQTEFTTLPGWDLDKKRGTLSSVMAPGQYKNTYCMGDHRGTPAMTQSATVKQWLLQRHGAKGSSKCLYKLQRETASTKRHSLNFHGTINGRGSPKQNKGKFPYTNAVNSWSHGCQVTFGKKFRDEVLALIGTSMNDDTLAGVHKVNPDTSTCVASRSDCNKCTTYTLLNGFEFSADEDGDDEEEAEENVLRAGGGAKDEEKKVDEDKNDDEEEDQEEKEEKEEEELDEGKKGDEQKDGEEEDQEEKEEKEEEELDESKKGDEQKDGEEKDEEEKEDKEVKSNMAKPLCKDSTHSFINEAISTLCNNKPKLCDGKTARSKERRLDWVYCLSSPHRKKSSMKALQKTKKEFPLPCKIEKKDKSYSFKTEVRHYILIKNDPTVKCFATNGNGKSALLRSN